jgi:hypothetical protein
MVWATTIPYLQRSTLPHLPDLLRIRGSRGPVFRTSTPVHELSDANIKSREVSFEALLTVKHLATVSSWPDEQFLPSLNSMHRQSWKLHSWECNCVDKSFSVPLWFTCLWKKISPTITPHILCSSLVHTLCQGRHNWRKVYFPTVVKIHDSMRRKYQVTVCICCLQACQPCGNVLSPRETKVWKNPCLNIFLPIQEFDCPVSWTGKCGTSLIVNYISYL